MLTPEKLAEIWPNLTAREREEISLHAQAIDDALHEWKPLPGPQTQMYYSAADILFGGGSAGMGKTDLLLGLAHKEHRRSIIFRREYTQLKGIIARGLELFDARGKGRFNNQKNFWKLNDGRLIELGACKNPGDENSHQGIPHDLKAFDEITHFHESQFRFLCGWVRTTVVGQRKRVVCVGNPPTTPEGEWVIKFWAPWLDDHHPNPAEPGELRWYTTIDGEEVEVGSGEPFYHHSELLRPESRTFIPGTIDDNPYLLSTGYKTRLQALPEPLRSKMLKGDFSTGREDDAWQVIPTEWVREAQARHRQMKQPDIPMTAIGVDPARAGQDKTVITLRYSNYIAPQKVYPGQATPDSNYVTALVLKERKQGCPVIVDVIGIGSAVVDMMRRNFEDLTEKQKIIAFNSSNKSEELDRTKQLSFINQRSLWYWRLREALDPANNSQIALPDDRELLADLCAARWEYTGHGIKVEPKDHIMQRIGRSPDKGDSLVYSFVTQKTVQIRSASVPFMSR